MGRVTPGEAALHTRMTAVGLAVLVGHHAHHFIAAHLCLERATDAAIGARRHHGMLGLADVDDRFLGQGRCRTGLHACAARNAFRVEELFLHSGRYDGIKTAPRDRERKSALHLLARAHAARAHDALRRIVGEIRVGLVLAGVRMPVTVIAVAHVAQADRARHILKLAIAVGSAGQAVERMIGDVKFHHALAQPLQAFGLGAHDHASGNRRRARRWRPRAALDLDQAKPAGAERLDHVGRAELWDLRSHFHGGTHDRGALGHRHRRPVDDERDGLLRARAGRAVVDLMDERHDVLLHSAASRRRGAA